MASPSPFASPPANGGGGTPARGGAAMLGDEAIWRRLKEAGFDEESVKRRDKAALIAYIAKLESELYEYQHNMGLLLLERKEWTSAYEQLKSSSESAELIHKHERAAQQSALVEARKQEESLRKNLGIQKECVANLEKALHDMRGETAERKVTYETKLAEALQLWDAAQKKFDEAEEKLLTAKSLEAESARAHNAALRSLQDIEEREDQLRRCQASFELEKESKEKEMSIQRKSLNEYEQILHVKEQGLQKEQALLDQRDEHICDRLAYLSHSEKRLEEEKLILETERKALVEEKNNLDLKMAAIVTREEAIIQKESLLDKRESELLIFQETIANKERAEIRRLNEEQQADLEKRRNEFETEMERKRMSFEAEMDVKIASIHDRETALNEREKSILEREQAIGLQHTAIAEKQEAIVKRSEEAKKEEDNFFSARESQEAELQREREEIQKMKLDLEKEKAFFEEEKQEAIQAQENLVITIAERNELLIWQTKLKEEIDSLRVQKLELLADADRLQAEKERFEIEWELIDEKKEELQKEALKIAEERKAITEHLKNGYGSIKKEKDSLHIQMKNNSESLTRDHQEFMSKMQCEHACWLSKIQQEREDLKRDIDIQRMELLNSVQARQAEIESYLREREEAFEQKKAKELLYINSQKEAIDLQLEHVASELLKLENERKEIALEREQRDQELSETKSTIEALNVQREKLQEQRKLLHAEREAINQQTRHLNELEELNIDSENKALSLRQGGRLRLITKSKVKDDGLVRSPNGDQNTGGKHSSSPKLLPEKTAEVSPSISTPIAWVRKCAEVIFKRSPEISANHDCERTVENRISGKVGKASGVKDVRLTPANCQENKASDINILLGTDKFPSIDSSGMNNAAVTANVGTVSDQLGNGAAEVSKPDDGATLGKKRLNNMVSHDHSDIVEPIQKQRRRITRKANGGTTSSCLSAMQETCSNNEHIAASLDQSGGRMIQEYANPELTDFNVPKDRRSSDDLHYENGKKLCSDELPFSGSYVNEPVGPQNQLTDKNFSDDEQSEETTASPTELPEGDRPKDNHEHNEDTDDEADEEEENVSVKKKLWNFLIT